MTYLKHSLSRSGIRILATVMFLLSAAPAELRAQSYAEDVNRDGMLNIADVVYLMVLARNNPMSPAIDFNGDGLFTTDDMVALWGNIAEHNLTPIASDSLVAGFGFEEGTEGWEHGFADYTTASDTASLEIEFDRRALPAYLNPGDTGLYLSGLNTPDDLFMFVKKKLGTGDGLEPSTEYSISMRITTATDAPSNCMGVGGSPGESVAFLAGAVPYEPEVVFDQGDGAYRINLRKDMGPDPFADLDMHRLGHVGNTVSECGGEFIFEYKTFTLDDFRVSSDENGELWLITGTDSGFESTTSFYVTEVRVVMRKVASPD